MLKSVALIACARVPTDIGANVYLLDVEKKNKRCFFIITVTIFVLIGEFIYLLIFVNMNTHDTQ